MSKETEFFHFYYWGLRRPLYRQSRQMLPFTLAVLANSFPRKTQAPQRTTLLSVGKCIYNSRSVCMFSATGLPWESTTQKIADPVNMIMVADYIFVNETYGIFF